MSQSFSIEFGGFPGCISSSSGSDLPGSFSDSFWSTLEADLAIGLRTGGDSVMDSSLDSSLNNPNKAYYTIIFIFGIGHGHDRYIIVPATVGLVDFSKN